MSGRFVFAGILVFTCMTSVGGCDEMEKSFTNSIGIKFVRIEPGSFLMGQEKGGDWDERPVHKVNITKPFYMTVTEITNAQYEQFDPLHRKLRGKLGFSKDDDEAVVFVSWHNAVKFCEWLSKKEGKTYRLPTEAEWEYTCRAGTTTPFHTGGTLPEEFCKNAGVSWFPDPARKRKSDNIVPLAVRRTEPNPWGLYDMHGNVEEWCYDWYGPYESAEQNDPVGLCDGDFKVTRGGSHSTLPENLRSANRMGTLPEDKSWLIGFRIVLGEPPATGPLPEPEKLLWARNVKQQLYDWSNGPDMDKPYFKGPRKYVKIPPNSNGPMFSGHNHQPAITACPNGDLLAIWYSTNYEDRRELGVVAARLRADSDQWEQAAPFWDAPDRNDHGSAIWWNGKKMLYQLNGLSAAATWGNLALIMRTSIDNGATWSKMRLINPEHGMHNQVIAGAFQTKHGNIILLCDAVTGGNGGSVIHIGHEGGKWWSDPGAGKPAPKFQTGQTGAWIAGIHAGAVELEDGRLIAFGRGDSISKRMPKSISADMGKTWTYSPSRFPPIGGGQRLVLIRLREGAIFFASFAKKIIIKDASGKKRFVSGLYAALSYDEGRRWSVQRIITDDGPARQVEAMDGQKFTMSANTAEPKGYMACTQSPDGIIHLITSRQHYAFNLAWLKTPMPAEQKSK